MHEVETAWRRYAKEYLVSEIGFVVKGQEIVSRRLVQGNTTQWAEEKSVEAPK